MAIIELYKSKKVLATTRESHEYIVPNGKKFRVIEFFGETGSGGNCAVILMWDTAGVQKPLWIIKGSNEMPNLAGPKTLTTDTNGVKKLAICLDNAGSNNVYMAGFARIWVED